MAVIKRRPFCERFLKIKPRFLRPRKGSWATRPHRVLLLWPHTNIAQGLREDLLPPCHSESVRGQACHASAPPSASVAAPCWLGHTLSASYSVLPPEEQKRTKQDDVMANLGFQLDHICKQLKPKQPGTARRDFS